MQESIRWDMQLYVVCVCAGWWSYTCRLDNEVIILVWSFSEVSILPCKCNHQNYKLTHIHTLIHTLNNDVQEGFNFCVKRNWCLVPWLTHTMSLKQTRYVIYTQCYHWQQQNVRQLSTEFNICWWQTLIHSCY